MCTICFELGHIALGGWMSPHFAVHGGRQNKGDGLNRPGQAHQTEQFIGFAMNQFGHEVGAGRGDQDGIGFSAQIDVRHVVAFSGIPLRGVNSLPRQRLHGDGCDELRRRFGHHHLNLGTCFDKRATQLGCLVAGNASCKS